MIRRIALISVSIAALLFAAGCDLSGSGSGMSAEDAGRIIETALSPMYSSVDPQGVAEGTTTTGLAGVSVSAIPNGATITFTNYAAGGYIYNGSLSVTVVGDIDIGMTVTYSGTIDITGTESHTIKYNFGMDLIVGGTEPELVFTGTITVDGDTFDVEELYEYMPA